MFPKFSATVLAVLVCLQGARSQMTTASIFPGDPNKVDGLQGEIEGTGADGTTYVVSGTVSSAAFTATLVEDSTHISEHIRISTEGAVAELKDVCGMDAEHKGSCTVVEEIAYNGFTTATTVSASAAITLAPVALGTSSASRLMNPHQKMVLAAITFISIALGCM